jgi:hypothetical protein
MTLQWSYVDVKSTWAPLPGRYGLQLFRYSHEGKDYVIKVPGEISTEREVGFLNASAGLSVEVKGYLLAPRGTRFGFIMPSLATIRLSESQFTLPVKVDLFHQIRWLLSQLHDRCNIIHGDIKSSNLLLEASSSAAWAHEMYYPKAFSVQWASPYRLSDDFNNPRPLIREEDYYAAAITVWEIFAEETPFDAIDEDDLEDQIKNGLKVDFSRIQDQEAREWVCQALANDKCANRN